MFEGKASVTANMCMGPSAFLLRMRAPAVAREAEPGQFVLLRVSTTYDPLLRRPFSICRTVGDEVEILYKVVGRGTSLLSEARPGDELEVMGPLGRGFMPPQGTPLLVAGGMGVAPLAFWAGKLRDMGHEPEVLLGAATSGELFGRKLLEDAGARVEVATEDGSEGFAGTVTELLGRVLEPSHHVYACGPRGMLRKVVALTEEMEVPCQISVEEVMACGVGACMGCAVRAREGGYLLVCRDGPVFDGRKLVL
ncbi:MAG: dihydroorotate dehydrogenase electron transfer subunit [Candidatus Latescibacterota bacterium]|nr:MAG: dihydroorotate dehydrogenase electron transfer subunit [Candidatus Latescibacterota bacterium]